MSTQMPPMQPEPEELDPEEQELEYEIEADEEPLEGYR
jgi:hypothetical protein